MIWIMRKMRMTTMKRRERRIEHQLNTKATEKQVSF